jgi:guanylate kinase
MANQGNLFVVAAPSGAGKTTLVRAVAEKLPQVVISISHTTRLMRPGEVHGIHYYFIDKSTFESMIQESDFIEHALVFEHYYGTSKTWVTEQLAQGQDVILEIDWQGHQQIKRLMPEAVGIFILPPSVDALLTRLTQRQQDKPEVIAKRLADVKETLSHIKEFDYVVLNEDFETAKRDLMAIIAARRLTGERQCQQFSQLIKEMQ